MTGRRERLSVESGALAGLRSTVEHDLLMLAALHASPLSRESVTDLWHDCYDGLLGLKPQSQSLRKAVGLFCLGLTDIPTYLDRDTLDGLSSAYFRLYADGDGGAPTCESAWRDQILDEGSANLDGIHVWQRRSGFSVDTSLDRRADHLVSQLQLLAHLVSPAGAGAPTGDVKRYLDEHLLSWIHRFAQAVHGRHTIRLYRGLAAMTAAYLNELANLLATLDGDAGVGLAWRERGVLAQCDGAVAPGAQMAGGPG